MKPDGILKEVADQVYDVFEDHDLTNAEALSVFAIMLRDIVQSSDTTPTEMLDEALTMLRDYVTECFAPTTH